MTVKIEVGRTDELDVKPGDVLECMVSEGCFTQGKSYKVEENGSIEDDVGDAWRSVGRRPYTPASTFRIISRASDTPKTWGEMTDAEKGELLLADHEGHTIQLWHTRGGWVDSVEFGAVEDIAYRVKPEPVRITHTLFGSVHGFASGGSLADGYQITFTTTDGKPDLDSIKMEEV